MNTREQVVEIMYYANANEKKAVAMYQLINRLGNLSTTDFSLTVKLLTDKTVTTRLDGMTLLWDKNEEWQSWLGKYPTFEDSAQDPKFRIFVDAIVRATKRVMDACK
jgi:hypothetical protein